jgi:hypothetical protein
MKPAFLQIRELESGETVLLGATEVTTRSPDDAFRHLTAAVDARRVGSTAANDRSSRSHAIFRVSLTCRVRVGVWGANGPFSLTNGVYTAHADRDGEMSTKSRGIL